MSQIQDAITRTRFATKSGSVYTVLRMTLSGNAIMRKEGEPWPYKGIMPQEPRQDARVQIQLESGKPYTTTEVTEIEDHQEFAVGEDVRALIAS